MRISDRTLGYISLIALICIFAGVAYGMYSAHQEITHKIYVDFSELGSLQPEDPVVIRGFRVGTVGKVKWMGDRARVEIKFDEPMAIREGTLFRDVNYAIMGQRRLEITPSKTGNVLPPETIHQGVFEPGIAEALRLMDDVNEQLVHVREAVLLVTEGDSTHKSAKEIYDSVMESIENVLGNADKSLSALGPALKNVFAQIDSAERTLEKTTVQIDTTVKSVTQSINGKIAEAENAIEKMKEISAKAESMINDVENAKAMDKLINSRELVDDVENAISKVNALIASINTKGIKIYDDNGKRVKLFTWKNTNIIGKTAREKAKIRAEKGESLPETVIPADATK